MTTNDGFVRFGNIREFAIDVRLDPDPDPRTRAPADAIDSWGAWRLWTGGTNLSEMEIETAEGVQRSDAVRWYLSPLFRWLSENWMPLLHESRIPTGGPDVDSRPLNARALYLGQLRKIGDQDEFAIWQDWAARHAIRTCSNGGILPDLFFQRVGDEIEVSWGSRTTPGSEAVTFLVEDGVARASIGAFAEVLDRALQWISSQQVVPDAPWVRALHQSEQTRRYWNPRHGLAWFLDGQSNDGPLTSMLCQLSNDVGPWLHEVGRRLVLTPLAPEVAMFGALSPDISKEAGISLLSLLINSRAANANDATIESLVENIPAWTARSPWDQGYELAREVLDDTDPNPDSPRTEIEDLVNHIGVAVHRRPLGVNGPRGVAIAGEGYLPTIAINIDHNNNKDERGERFTIAHELCHLLFDRNHAHSIFHTSTPWAQPAVEQRANAFAAMILMPPDRLRWFGLIKTQDELRRRTTDTARRLSVGRVALIRHLSNVGYIDEVMRDSLLSQRYHQGSNNR